MTENQSQSEYPLLIEGARSYPQALAAISEFQTQVVAACQEALESELPKISSAMGIALSGKDLLLRIRPRKTEKPDGVYASLGFLINRDKTEGWRQYYHVVWGKDGLRAASSIWFKDETLATKVSDALKKAQPRLPYFVELEEGEASLMRRATAEEMAQLSRIQQELFHEWTRLWQRIGGLKSCKA